MLSVLVFQDVASDSGIGDAVFGGNDGPSHLPTEVEINERSPTGTAEGISLPGSAEGMPLNDTTEGIPPSGAVDGKKLKLTVLGGCAHKQANPAHVAMGSVAMNQNVTNTHLLQV